MLKATSGSAGPGLSEGCDVSGQRACVCQYRWLPGMAGMPRGRIYPSTLFQSTGCVWNPGSHDPPALLGWQMLMLVPPVSAVYALLLLIRLTGSYKQCCHWTVSVIQRYGDIFCIPGTFYRKGPAGNLLVWLNLKHVYVCNSVFWNMITSNLLRNTEFPLALQLSCKLSVSFS